MDADENSELHKNDLLQSLVMDSNSKPLPIHLVTDYVTEVAYSSLKCPPADNYDLEMQA